MLELLKEKLYAFRLKRRSIESGRIYKDYLKAGKYCYGNAPNVIIHENYMDRQTAIVFGESQPIKKRNAKVVLSIRKAGTLFNGIELLVTSSGNIKMISADRDQILTVFHRAEELAQYMTVRDDLVDLFPSAALLSKDESSLCIVEELLQRDDLTVMEMWHAVLMFYQTLLQNARSHGKTKLQYPLNHFEPSIQKVFDDYCLRAMPEYLLLPVAIQHGDLWQANVFICNGTCKFIDFDDAGFHMFFYDLALYMFTESFVNHNDCLIKGYLHGDFDEEMKCMCRNVGIDFNESTREPLFVLAFEEMLYTRFNCSEKKTVALSAIHHIRTLGFSL